MVGRGISLTLFDLMMAMGLVDEHAADGARSRSYKRAARAADLSAHHCSSHRSARNELGLGVMMMVVRVSLCDGVFMRLLR